MAYLVDTNVLGELARPRPDEGVLSWAAGVASIQLSAVTMEEIAFGLARRPSRRVEEWFDSFVESSCTVLPVTREIALQAGITRARLAAAGSVRTQADMLIAATAAIHGLTLVTRNSRDFAGCPIAVQNPFSRP